MSEWRDVVGYEGRYQVSELGGVMSVGYGLLSPSPRSQAGYLGVGLYKDGVCTEKYVHQIVMEAFVGPCPQGKQVLHGPLGRQFNGVANLRYGTGSENMKEYWDAKRVQNA